MYLFSSHVFRVSEDVYCVKMPSSFFYTVLCTPSKQGFGSTLNPTNDDDEKRREVWT